MRQKILEMFEMLVTPFDKMIDGIAIDGMEGVEADLVPEPVQLVLALIKEKLTANRAAFEDGVVEIVQRYLTEEDVDTIIAFNKSAGGSKLRDCFGKIQDELSEAAGKWRNDTLEPHQDEVKRMLGAVEPSPAPAPADEPPTPPAA